MASFQVPQFIDIEDRIIGPLTLRQFVIIVCTVVVIFVLNNFLAFWLMIIVGFILGALGLALAFLKINGQYFSRVAFNAIKYFISPRLYVWRRTKREKNMIVYQTAPVVKPKEKKRLSLSELEEFSDKLDS